MIFFYCGTTFPELRGPQDLLYIFLMLFFSSKLGTRDENKDENLF